MVQTKIRPKTNMELYNIAEDHVTNITGRPVNKWNYDDKSLFQTKMILLQNPVEIPAIINTSNLNHDPCIDDVEQKTDSTPDMMKAIFIGIVIAVVLGVIK